MNERTRVFYDALKAKEYRRERRPLPEPLPRLYERPFTSRKYVEKLRYVLDHEVPILLPGDPFGFHKSCTDTSMGFHGGNYTLNYARVIGQGFDAVIRQIRGRIEAEADPEKRAFGEDMIECLEMGLETAEKNRQKALEAGDERLSEALSRIPREPARNFYEALLFLRIILYLLRSAMTEHVGLGRFDQYMLPYFERDLARGVPEEELFDLLEQFFISLNVDADVYHGVQTGDDGQSMVLGGFDAEGNYLFNRLSELCLLASEELKLIDPKINIRVGKKTSAYVYIKGTRLTKAGLGFPQYLNDDVVVPGLIRLGYRPEDAQNYVVAACWEFIIPNVGGDVPNLTVTNFPLIVSDVLRDSLAGCGSFEELMRAVEEKIRSWCDRIVSEKTNWSDEAPMTLDAVFMDGCIDNLVGVYNGGARYQNYGSHGVGIANAADALAAVRQLVFEEKSVTPEEHLAALKADFEGYESLRERLLACPKMGNNDDRADLLASRLMEAFSKALAGRPNDRGGVWRAGTGSAQAYVFQGKKTPATADGRKAWDPFPSSFSPALEVKTDGLLSTFASFTKYDLSRIINGGPLTVEVHDSVFRNEMGILKTAELVRKFIELGGHELQINAVNRDVLLDAQKHPENYPNLIVRVWGWSGYFVELAPDFQNQIIRRLEYTV